MKIRTLATPELGDRSYVVHDGRLALVVDPQRDLDRVEALLAADGVDVGLVVETHIHNDYVTGGYELARRHGARYAVAAADEVAFDREPVAGGDRLTVGDLRVDVVDTPGHTDTHLAYVVDDSSGEPGAVFTGGSLLYGSVGRTDLIDPARAGELAGAQYRSVRSLGALPGDTFVYPTHGFGSFCSGGQTLIRDSSTLAQERAYNDAFLESDEAAFVRRLLAGLGDFPTYYAQMGPANRRGPGAARLERPEPLTGEAVARELVGDGWVVDLRDRAAYATDHLAATVGIELGDQFATYVGWTLPWGARITLLGEDAAQLDDARRQLSRIGIEDAGEATIGDVAGLQAPRSSYRRVDFAELAAMIADPAADAFVLDVRNDDEWADGRVPGARHVPLHQLAARMEELPTDREIWVHCRSGYRAAIAAGLLDRAGRTAVHVDDHVDRARALGLLAA